MLRCSQRIDGAWMLVIHCDERTSTVATSCELVKTTMLWVPFGASTLLIGQLQGHLACKQLLQLSQSFCFVGPQLSRSSTRQEGCSRWECAGVCCAGAVNKHLAGEQSRAAAKIQAHWKGYRSRHGVASRRDHVLRVRAATVIQRMVITRTHTRHDLQVFRLFDRTEAPQI